jgi:Zn-dependent peptidase ImmA (M78 family)
MTTIELYDMAEKEGVKVFNFDLSPIISVSHMNDQGNCFIGVDYNLIESSKEEKIIIAHELGHCEKGAFYNRYSSCDIKSRHESRADKWAIEKLIPKDQMEDAIMSCLEEIWQIAEYFDVDEEMVKKAFWIYFDKVL